MEKKQMIVIIAVIIIAIAAIAAIVIMSNGNQSQGPVDPVDPTKTVTDSAGRVVEVPASLDNGIVTVGWNVLKVLSFFDAHSKVIEVDYQETQMAYGSLQPHYYSYDMSKMKTHEDSTMGNFSEASIETIAKEKPSLVIMTKNIYDKYTVSSDALAKACTLVVIDLSPMSLNFWQEGKDGKLTVHDVIAKSLNILGDVLKEDTRDEAIIKTLNDTLADIVSKAGKDKDTLVNLSGSQMAMGTGDLNLVFPVFNVLQLAGATNAAAKAGYTAPPWFATVEVEKFTSSYDFDMIMYDPSAPRCISNPDDQAVLKWLYGLQGTADEKEIYIILTTALCGYDMMNVIADAYFTEVVVGKTITMDQMKTIMTKLYKDLFGNSVGSKIWDGLVDATGVRGTQTGVYTGLWEKVKVGLVDGKYTFVKA